MWTKEAIRAKIQTSDKMVERSLLKLYARQTADEQASQGTHHENGQGFNGTDAFILSSFAEWIIKGQAKNIPEGKRLSAKQREIARKKLLKYAGQLLEEAESAGSDKQVQMSLQ